MITGIVSEGVNISGTIRQSVDSTPASSTVNGSISVAEMPGPGYEEYSGFYEIEPVKTQQVLTTQYKLMSQDLLIHGIYYHEEMTPAGGKIVTIGSD